MKNKLKSAMKKVIIFILITIFALYAPTSAVFATFDEHSYVPPAGNIGSVQDILMTEAHAQLAMYVLSACVGGGINRWEEWDNVHKASVIFDRTGDDLTINVGYWYEYQIQGKYDDGRINCSDTGGSYDVVTRLTSLIGLSNKSDADKKLYCGGSEGTASGVFKNYKGYQCGSSNGAYMRNGDSDEDYSNQARDRGSDGMFGNYAWAKHMRDVFNSYADENHAKWEHTFEEVAHYYEMVGYYLYRTEIGIKCGGVKETLDSKPSDMNLVLIDVTQDSTQAGKIVYKRYDQNGSFSNEFVNNKYVGSCKTMIERANMDDLYGKYRARMLATLNHECHNDIERRKKEVEDAGGELNEETMSAYNAAKADQSKYSIGMWIKGSDEEGWQCADIGDFQGAHQEDPHGDELEDIDSSEADCYTNAGSLGWILCPIINQVSDAIQGIYTKYITPFLVLDSELFKENSGTYEAWKQFRDIANIIFVIIFIVVIFSQLTGVGIDNYGIKKILPKLIIGAILINLSYIICQLAIDVANIVGYSIGGLFDSIQNGIDYNNLSLSETGGQTLKQIAAPIILIVLIGLICAGAYLAIGPTVLIPVFMAVISVFIAILFCFILLAVRKAFAVLLVVASPIAFACYMLPNTKSIFDKWFGAFKGVLLAFPICSAMIYGGQMVARIIVMAAGSSNMPSTIALSAAVISIIPIFMIPKAISGSMAAISGGIVGLQNRLTGRARGGIARSGLAQDLQRRQSGYKYDSNGNIVGRNIRGKVLDKMAVTKGSKRRLAMRRAGEARAATMDGNITSQWSGQKGVDRAALMQQSAEAQREAQDVSDIEASIGLSGEVDNNDALQKGLTDAMVSGDTKRMKAYQNILYGKGEDGRDTARKAVEAAQATGKVTSATLQSYGSNAMNKWAKDLKANARSDFEFAKQAAASGSGAGNIGDYKTIDKAQKYTAENMATMDDSQVKSMVASMGDSSVSQEQKDYAARAAYEALHNDNISLKGERRADLEKLAAGYTPPADASAGGGSESGGVVSPAMLTDEDIAYRNKLKEMSERGDSSPDELHIDHSPSSGGSSSSGGAPKPSTPSPTGTNSGTGKPRAKEGNKFDYYPRQKGESSEAYGQRLNRQKLIEQKYQSDPPKAGESHADWMKRVGIPPSGTSA